MKKFTDIDRQNKLTHWKGRDVTKLNRMIDIQDPDTGYELVKKSLRRSLGYSNGALTTDPKKIEQPKID